jgi:hypothetical protein
MAVGVFGVIVLIALGLFVLIPSNGPSAAAVVQQQPGATAWDSSQRTTLLLAGTGADPGSPATDLIVASYTPSPRRLSLVFVPTTLWVTIPGFGPGTLGQAYADGGTRLLLLTTQSALGTPIPYYALAGPRTIAHAIDVFGGAPVQLPARTSFGSGTPKHSLGPGSVRLSGADTETYVSGLGSLRGPTEMNLLLSLLPIVQTPDNRIPLASLLNSLGPSISTNFPLNHVPDLLSRLKAVGPDRTDTVTLGPLSDTAMPYVASGEQIYLPRWDQIHRLTRRLLAGAPPAGTVDVLNGGGVLGQAEALSTWLRANSIAVRNYATAPAGNYPQTEVIVRPGAGTGQLILARAAAALLQAPVVTGTVRGDRAPVIIIIGRDFVNPAQQ